MGRKWSDNFVSNLAGAITASSTTLSVTTGDGTFAPTITGRGAAGSALDFIVLTLEDASGNIEKIRCEAHTAASDTFGSGGYPLVRGYDGSTAAAWPAGATVMVEIRIDKSFLQNADSKLLAVDPAIAFGQKDSVTSGLNFGYYGGVLAVDGVLTTIADGSITLTASQTNYVERTAAGVVSSNTTGFTAGRSPMYVCVTNTTVITTVTDSRPINSSPVGRVIHALSGGEIAAFTATATAAEARNGIIEVTGALTGNTTFILPQVNSVFFVKNGTSGAFALTFKGATGAGVAVTQGRAAAIYYNGTDFVRADSDSEAIDATIARTGQVNSFSKAQVGVPVALTDAASVAVDMSLANNFTLLTTGAVGATRALANPTNAVAGTSGTIAVTQDATGSRALTYGANYKFAAGSAPVLTTTANAIDLLAFYVLSPTVIYISAAKDVR